MLKFLKNIGFLLYRIWFYLLVALPMLIFSPLLLLTTLSEKTYRQFYWLARNIWAKFILFGMGMLPKIKWQQHLEEHNNYMLVANHTSMLDIMLMLYVSKNPFVFVGKAELAKIPVFGFFYKRVCILVDRSNAKSRAAVYKAVQGRLSQGLSICIFPEGGVPEKEVRLDTFKDGAFRMAIRHNIPIVPMVFYDCKKRLPWEVFGGSPGMLRVQIFPFRATDQLSVEDTNIIKNEIRALMLTEIN
ncbi:1-acyl-sn-glycerol-3-phosphate acyltransferase [Flavobacterium sp. ASW18X]|uniref:lysophospholipid acyltransferase family protein n=1 Tax=Flavobacterium sp. ASW18X TaxID=2572595 RepID=UPI0010ADB7D9|nr:lysophospholipid acyltransferase family protein [Flavobacterium sp. ASW18X]TKD65050.1 1-acyl-sn-glycerol-3-phosphate acyltransferase [Flavobacterium sp. ASW18X]